MTLSLVVSATLALASRNLAQDPVKANGSGTQGTTQKKSGEDEKKAQEKKAAEKKAAERKAAEKKAAEDDLIPMGTDPADIAAMRGAQQMIEAEKKLREMIRSGKLKNIDQILTFEEISSWPYEDSLKGMPKQVKKLDGKRVMMTGFMLPIDEVENIKEFLLVQSLWSCCYGQPPDINGIVRVVMKGKKRIDYQFEPLKIIGDFKVIASVEDGYCLDIFQLHTDDVQVIR